MALALLVLLLVPLAVVHGPKSPTPQSAAGFAGTFVLTYRNGKPVMKMDIPGRPIRGIDEPPGQAM